jgi:aminopeptidase N
MGAVASWTSPFRETDDAMRRSLPASFLLLAAAPAFAQRDAAQEIDIRQPELSALTRSSGGAPAPQQKAMRFDRADLAFKVHPDGKTIEGEATLVFTAGAPLDALVVDFDPHYAIDAVEVDGRKATWRNPEGRMTVDLPRPRAPGAHVALHVGWHGRMHEAAKAPWDGGIVWSKAPTGEPWIATAVQGEGCDLLWPCIDQPWGEPAVVEQRISVPAPLVAPSNGVLLEVREKDGWRTYRWRARQPDSYAIALNIGPYELKQADYRSRFGNVIPLRYWHLKGDDPAKVDYLFAQLPRFLDFFEEKIGPYPWGGEKVGVVETPHLGMEHQTINAYGNGYRRDANGYDWLMQHEFSHEWFGNQVTNSDWNDMWLHEGFGEYMQPLYLQWLRGDAGYFAELMAQRARIKNNEPVVAGHPRASDQVDVKDEDIYFKGSWTLHTLRGLIGDEAFFAATRRLVYGRGDPKPGNFAPRYAATQDFIDAVNAATGKDYGWFFDVYLKSTALPDLQATREGGALKLRWKTEGDRPFPMPVQVRVGSRIVDVPMTGGQGEVAIADGESWTLDPHSKVLREAPEIAEYQNDMAERAKAAKKP